MLIIISYVSMYMHCNHQNQHNLHLQNQQLQHFFMRQRVRVPQSHIHTRKFLAAYEFVNLTAYHLKAPQNATKS